MSEKPLHVKVAEASGCEPQLRAGVWVCLCSMAAQSGRPHGRTYGSIAYNDIARYDTDWSATGPLIEKYGITVEFIRDTGCGTPGTGCGCLNWEARGDLYTEPVAQANAPLLAVCNLILALHASGKLPK